MDRWKIKTDCLKGFEVGDIVVKIAPGDSPLILVCVLDIKPLTEAYFEADLIELKPDWFEKIEEEPETIYAYGRSIEKHGDLVDQIWLSDPENMFFVKRDAHFPKDKIQKYKLVPVNEDDPT